MTDYIDVEAVLPEREKSTFWEEGKCYSWRRAWVLVREEVIPFTKEIQKARDAAFKEEEN